MVIFSIDIVTMSAHLLRHLASRIGETKDAAKAHLFIRVDVEIAESRRAPAPFFSLLSIRQARTHTRITNDSAESTSSLSSLAPPAHTCCCGVQNELKFCNAEHHGDLQDYRIE